MKILVELGTNNDVIDITINENEKENGRIQINTPILFVKKE